MTYIQITYFILFNGFYQYCFKSISYIMFSNILQWRIKNGKGLIISNFQLTCQYRKLTEILDRSMLFHHKLISSQDTGNNSPRHLRNTAKAGTWISPNYPEKHSCRFCPSFYLIRIQISRNKETWPPCDWIASLIPDPKSGHCNRDRDREKP